MTPPGSIDDLGKYLDECEEMLPRARGMAVRKSYETSLYVVSNARRKLLSAIDELHRLADAAEAARP